jgi:hypothetical protein
VVVGEVDETVRYSDDEREEAAEVAVTREESAMVSGCHVKTCA